MSIDLEGKNPHKKFRNRTQVYLKDGSFFIIDNEDWQIVKQFRFHKSLVKSKNFTRDYIATSLKKNGKYKHQNIHRLLLNPKDGVLVDHIDGNARNNRQSNLRMATATQNNINKRMVKQIQGIHYDKKRNIWRVRFKINGKETHIGWFKNYESAKISAIESKNKYHGEFSPYWKDSEVQS